MNGQRVLIVTTSHKELGKTDEKTGVWLEELATPYYVFKDAGAEIVIASPKGGQVPVDPTSIQKDALTLNAIRFTNDPDASKSLSHSRKLADINAEDFDVLFLPGGHGPMWDLAENSELGHILSVFKKHGRLVGAVCHGPAGLLAGNMDKASSFVKGRKLTAFTNEEEKSVGLQDTVPFLLEDRLKKAGAQFKKAGAMEVHVVRDGNLVTGQNPASSGPVAQMLLKTLNESINKAA